MGCKLSINVVQPHKSPVNNEKKCKVKKIKRIKSLLPPDADDTDSYISVNLDTP